ncbi:hypothetical protein K2D_26090 [Planctomycetes bacterium K2D]|uniref:Trypsin n=1 Tax=Botrimarina mediterranea TaxID=2528022 RepID=A0A518K9D3_9BACT|nr:hypothetical protein Spa11_26070 [Botrimarina mediterranea]QDV79000.1 hypothetical protein K2D_26090 [Planctomycetes bacterium K2D]
MWKVFWAKSLAFVGNLPTNLILPKSKVRVECESEEVSEWAPALPASCPLHIDVAIGTVTEDPSLSHTTFYSIRLTSLLAAVLAFGVAPCDALIVKTWNGAGTPALINTTPPVDDPGSHNLPTNKTGIYLGDNLFLTAYHADTATSGSVEIAGGTFPIIPGSATNLANPSTFGSTRRTSNGSLNISSDLRLYRVGVDTTTGLSPEELDPEIRRLTLASRLPNTSSEQLTIFGKGRIRTLNDANDTNGQFYYNSSGSVLNDPADWPTSSYRGFGFTNSPVSPTPWQWGTNQRSSTTPNGVVRVSQNMLMEGSFLDTIGFAIRFDENGLPDEAQGVAGDSGGPVFWKDGDEWVLAGLMHGIYFGNGQPSVLSLFGGFTGISDLSYSTYASQIDDARTTFSKMGDIDLDGQVTGGIVNGVATGDLGILVDNWLSSSVDVNVHSWMKGDLNLDGNVDLGDFVLMREALGGSISSSAFAQLVSAVAIPEPSALALAASTVLVAMRRRRR